MGTGKSTVGRLAARQLGLRFVDCDDLIAQRAGCSIPEIFQHEGELAFRRLERQAISEVAREVGVVIATGGGALNDRRNFADLRAGGLIVCLAARSEVIWQRVRRTADRPMLYARDPRRRLQQLLQQRAPLYAQADFTVDTSDSPIARIVREVVGRYRAVRVALGERSYDILIAEGMLSELGGEVRRRVSPTSAVVVTDSHVARHYGRSVLTILQTAAIPAHLVTVPSGERSKTLTWAKRLYGRLLEHRLDRAGAVIALGGGVIGDLAGFVAATYLRGVAFVQLPTSLLAQVDASVGGKVAVNHPKGKNLVGAFYQPRLVAIDPTTLHSLSPRELRCGLAEVVKHGAIADAGFLSYLEEHAADCLALNVDLLRLCIRRSCEIKSRVVAADEHDRSGERALLNFGHTVGHAIETHFGYRRYRHGEAVALGMVVAARISERLGLLAGGEVNRLRGLLKKLDLPVRLPTISADELLPIIGYDKKAHAGELRMVLLRHLGVAVVRSVPLRVMAKAINELGIEER